MTIVALGAGRTGVVDTAAPAAWQISMPARDAA
ncbi:hypothetical protein RCH08_000915 [Janthinobacterium sp. CG_S6]|nr:hypothetical protein [Janthinobacterium sp. CG_S6]